MRLGTRLFLLVVLSSLLPAALVLLTGWMQLRQQIRLWTIPSVERSLQAAAQTNRQTFARLQDQLTAQGEALAGWQPLLRLPADSAATFTRLEERCRESGIDLAQVYLPDRSDYRRVFSFSRLGKEEPDAARVLAAMPPHAPVVPLRLNSSAGDFLAQPAWLRQRSGTTASEPGAILLVGSFLGAKYFEQLDAAASGLQFYRRLEEIGLVLRTGYGLLAGIVFVLSLGLSLWLAVRVAGSISRPVDDLIRGMEEVGRISSASPGALAAAEHSPIPEMARLAAAFQRMRATLRTYEERLRETERVRGSQETARHVAHEIRNALTPVTAAVGVLDRQLDGLSGEKRRRGERAIELIRREAQRMSSLAGAFSEYSRFPEQHPQRLALAALVEAQARAEIPERIAFTMERQDPLPEVVADRDEMERLFRNLIKNAVESIPEAGSIHLALAAGAVTGAADDVPATEPAAATLRIELRDTGAGMDEETLRRAFQPGFTTKETGTGVGLALVQSTLSRYGGSVRIESRPGQGTRCLVEIPAAPQEGEHVRARPDRG